MCPCLGDFDGHNDHGGLLRLRVPIHLRSRPRGGIARMIDRVRGVLGARLDSRTTYIEAGEHKEFVRNGANLRKGLGTKGAQFRRFYVRTICDS